MAVVSALVVAAVKNELPFSELLIVLFILAPLAGVLHWLESWVAHDMAFRLLAELRISLFKKLDELGPAYLVRRRSGDLVATATHDVELVEFFFAHTVAPAFVAVLVPAVVLATLASQGWQMALALAPFLALVSVSPLMMRKRIDALGSRAREAMGSLNAHVVDTIQGLNEIIAFQQTGRRRREFVDKIEEHHSVRIPFFRDLTIQMAALEVCTGLGGLVVIITGVNLVQGGQLDATILPLLTLLAMAAFLPVSEIAHMGRQLADTLGASRRIYAVNNEVPAVINGHESADGHRRFVELHSHARCRVHLLWRRKGRSGQSRHRGAVGANDRLGGTIGRRQDDRRSFVVAFLGSRRRTNNVTRQRPHQLETRATPRPLRPW